MRVSLTTLAFTFLTIPLFSRASRLIDPTVSSGEPLISRATYHESCDADIRRVINEVIGQVRFLAMLGRDASDESNHDDFDRVAFFNHFRRDSGQFRTYVHGYFRAIFFEADQTLRPRLYTHRGRHFRPVPIYCDDSETRCRHRPAFLTHDGTQIVIVRLSFQLKGLIRTPNSIQCPTFDQVPMFVDDDYMAIDRAGLLFRFIAGNRITHAATGPLSDHPSYFNLLRDFPWVMPARTAVGTTFAYLYFVKDLHARFTREQAERIEE